MGVVSINPKEVETAKLHGLLLSAVAPRPIAFASTVDINGNVNLSPFSFFNVFSANPPILIFSPARRVRDNTTKHTLENAIATKEVTINIVNFPIVEQMSLSSTEYDKGVNEFSKSGLTQVPSIKVKPPRVKESPVSFECIVENIMPLGEEGGAGNLIIAKVVMVHVDDTYTNKDGKLDTTKLDLVARMGESWYCRASKDALFEIPKPIFTKGIGVDKLPKHILESEILTGNNLGRLGNSEKLPTQEEISTFLENNIEVQTMINNKDIPALHTKVKDFLKEENVSKAILVAFSFIK
ncbi:flavin reductase family protein [uncultured Maribacter sp.]|uniref:flavin reductase family protein n=1 Tax=uncultured Maribacter sp. TaxID=431308 RepID=UPI002603796D|nr:flavin reductase family protein [uncultured Maribacter sp.]